MRIFFLFLHLSKTTLTDSQTRERKREISSDGFLHAITIQDGVIIISTEEEKKQERDDTKTLL